MSNAKKAAAAPAAAKETTPKAPVETKTPADKAEETETKAKKTGKGETYTYVGAGDSSPYVINLMGKQEFTRGEEVEVTDPELLAKLPGMSTFVKGKADAKTLHLIDQEGKAAYEAQRAADVVTNAKYSKKHHGE